MMTKRLKKLTAAVMLSALGVNLFPAAGFAAGETSPGFAITAENAYISLDSAVCSGGTVTISGVDTEPGAVEIALRAVDTLSGDTLTVEQTAVGADDKFSFVFSAKDSKNIQINLSGRETGIMKAVIDVSEGTVSEKLSKLEKSVASVKALIDDCKADGISTDYEEVGVKLIERSIDVMRRESGLNTDANIINHNYGVAVSACAKLADTLRGYLSGKKQPLTAARGDPTSIKYSGKSLTALFDGVRKPIFLNGYCIGFGNGEDTGVFGSLGQNFVSEALPFNEVIGKVGYPVGWSINPGTNGYADADITVTDEESYSGNSSLKIVNRSSASENKRGYLWQTYVVKPSTTYRFGGWYKSGGRASASISFNFGKRVATITNNTGGWQPFSYTYTTAANESGLIVLQIGMEDVCDAVYFDDFYLYEGRSMVNKLANPDFENTFRAVSGSELGVCMESVYDFKTRLNEHAADGIAMVMSPSLYTLKSSLTEADATNITSYSSHLPYNITHPEVLKLTKMYFDTVLPVLKDCGNLIAVELTNEPTFSAATSPYYLPDYRKWLENKYGSVSALNSTYSTAYSSFSNLTMPTEYSQNVAYNDYREFNDSIMTAYDLAVSEMVHDNAPDLWVMSKVMMYTANHYQTRFKGIGINYEDIAAAFDVNGNDAWAYLDTNDTIILKNMWYDFQTSVKERPVINTENHIILDNKKMDYSKKYAEHSRTDMWQGALHGLSATLEWLWGICDHQDNGEFRNVTAEYRLDQMLENAKTGYDINRLSEEVSAIANKKPDAAILYSYTSTLYNTRYEDVMAGVYKTFLALGGKPTFVTEENFAELAKCGTVIIPPATNVPKKTLELVSNAIDSGKKVIIIGTDSLSRDENNLPHTGNEIEKIRANVEYVSNTAYKNRVKALAGNDGFGGITAKISDNVDIEISSAVIGNRLIVNICNYSDDTDVTASLEYYGSELKGGMNLLTGESCDGRQFTVKSLTPVMLEFDLQMPVIEFSEDSTNVTASVNYIEYEKSHEADFYIAVYTAQGQLKSVKFEKKDINIGKNSPTMQVLKTDIPENGYVRAFLWERGSQNPLATGNIYNKRSEQ